MQRRDGGEVTSGTGIPIYQDGNTVIVITNKHFAQDGNGNTFRECSVGETGRSPGTVITIDSREDLALVLVQVQSRWQLVSLGSKWPVNGSYITCVGYPNNGSLREFNAVVTGAGWFNRRPYFGESGGPILDRNNQCVGIVKARLADVVQDSSGRLGLAVTVESIHDFLYRAANKFGGQYPILTDYVYGKRGGSPNESFPGGNYSLPSPVPF